MSHDAKLGKPTPRLATVVVLTPQLNLEYGKENDRDSILYNTGKTNKKNQIQKPKYYTQKNKNLTEKHKPDTKIPKTESINGDKLELKETNPKNTYTKR
jgi:hypothetical protein